MGRQPANRKRLLLLESLDRAVTDPAVWREVCDGLADLVDATGALIVPADAASRNRAVPHSESLGEIWSRYLESDWRRRDPRQKAFAIAAEKGFATDHDIIAPEAMRKHPYYAEFLRPAGLQWFVSISFSVDGRLWAAAAHRGPRRGPFMAEEIREFTRVRQPLALAAKQAAVLGHRRLESVDAVLAEAARGVAALDWAGRIVWMNPRAEELLSGVQLARGRLRSDDAALDGKLGNLVDAAIGFRRTAGALVPAPVFLPAGGGRTLLVNVIPMPRDFQALLSGAAALLTMHEVRLPQRGLRGDFRRRFRLTAREAELAAELMNGNGLAAAAAALGISVQTARQHLKAVFVKTGVNRQAKLIALLGRLQE